MSQDLQRKVEVPRYQMVKEYIRNRVRQGILKSGAKIPSEGDLVEILGVSRMTVHRALRELSNEGVVDRVQGLGSFVASARATSELMEVNDIAAEIASRGGVHTQQIKTLETLQAGAERCCYFDMPRGSKLHHSLIVNMEDCFPIQVEEQWVLPWFSPDYLLHDFHAIPSSVHLRSLAKPSRVEHVVHATNADQNVRDLLQLAGSGCVLVLTRRTWVDDQVVTMSVLSYPGDSYGLVSRRSKP